MKLTIELIPSELWYKNLRSDSALHNWNKLRSDCYDKAAYKCEICSDNGIDQGYRHTVECHEEWEYNFETFEQKLTRLVCLCPNCHKVKHAGLSLIKGELPLVVLQLMMVNKISQDEAEEYIEDSFIRYETMNSIDWKQDLSYVANPRQEEPINI